MNEFDEIVENNSEKLVKFLLNKEKQVRKCGPYFIRVKQLEKTLNIFNFYPKDISIEFGTSDVLTAKVDIVLNVERFADAVPVMEFLESEFGDCYHTWDYGDAKLRRFGFKGTPVTLSLYAGDGCIKVEEPITEMKTKLVCG